MSAAFCCRMGWWDVIGGLYQYVKKAEVPSEQHVGNLAENMIDNPTNSFYYQKVSAAWKSLAADKQEGNG